MTIECLLTSKTSTEVYVNTCEEKERRESIYKGGRV